MPSRGYPKLWFATATLIGALLATPAPAETLITAHEAQLPPDNSVLRSIERGPEVIAVNPPQAPGMIPSPFEFKVKFQAHGGTQIDLDSLRVVYMRGAGIYLTSRVKPYVRAEGIDMPNAEVPAGEHRIMIFVKDSVGHEGSADIRFDVEK
jgi:hypothetical protein